MADNQPRRLVAGASGRLGRLTIAALLETVPPGRITALVRQSEDGVDFGGRPC
jgi:uncharacterized protein YbjT (DUF2867 family)